MLHRDLTPLNVFVCDGRKLTLMEIRRLRAAGHRITLVTETRFWRLTSAKR